VIFSELSYRETIRIKLAKGRA